MKGVEGYHIWWDFGSSARTSRSELEELTRKYGLDQYLPRAPASGNLIRRTMTAVSNQLKEKDFHFSLVATNDEYIIYRIWKVERFEGDADMKKEVLLQYSKEHEFFILNPSSDEGAPAEIQAVILPVFLSITAQVTTSDVSAVVSRALVDMHRVPLKSAGHIYFVDKRYEARLDNLEAFMKACGHKFYVAVAFTREEYITEGVEHTIRTALQKINERADKMKQQRSFNTALTELDDLEKMTALYGTILSGAKSLIDKRIEEARSAVKDRLSEVIQQGKEGADE